MKRLMDAFVQRRYWVYFFPGLMDCCLATFLLYGTLKAMRLGADAVHVGILGAVFGVAYFAASLALSRWASRRTSFAWMFAGCGGFLLLVVPFAVASSLAVLFVLMAVCAVATTLFFIGFQLFMQDVTRTSAGRAAAVYTFSWSSGLAVGSLLEGILASRGPVIALLPVTASAGIIIAGLWLVRGHVKAEAGGGEGAESVLVRAGISPDRRSAYVKIGWIGVLVASFLGGGFRFLLPKLTMDHYGFSEAAAGRTIAGLLFAQGLAAILPYRMRSWRYRFGHHPVFLVLALAGLITPFVLGGGAGFVALAILLGAFLGHQYFHGVFYSLDDAGRSGRNISVNEAIVGLSSITGPFLLGVALQSGRTAFFLTAVASVLLAVVVEAFIARRADSSSDRSL